MSDRRRFLILTPAIDGADGISELSRQVVRSLGRAFGSSRVEVWALDGGAAPQTTTEFWSAGGSRTAIVRRVVARSARRSDDLHVIVLHAHLAPLATLLAARGARVSVFLIGIEVWTALRARERRALDRADRLVAISAFTADRFRHANPSLADCPIDICAPGVAAAPPRDPVDLAPGFALIVGRLSADEQYKGHDTLIDRWPRIQQAVGDARLVVAGDGDDRVRLEALVAARGLGEAVTFVGRVSDAELAALYHRAAFFVMPSTREGFGLVYLEAMRAGKPCIAVHGAADEIIRHGVDGFVVDTQSTDALQAAIVRLFSRDDERARMGAAAKQRVADRFTEARFGARLLVALGESVQPARPSEATRLTEPTRPTRPTTVSR